MTQRIEQHLNSIEKNYNIKILHACETGSRAWGFPSNDSDYDIRFIYMHPKDWYLSLKEGKDTIDLMLDDNETDLSGWDLRKSLRLLWKSNPPLFEKIHSQIVYLKNDPFLTDLQKLSEQFYSRIASHYHYFNMAQNHLVEIENRDSFRLKKLFYALRAAVACRWIMEKEENPPVFFPSMLHELPTETGIKTQILQLIEFKKLKSESYEHGDDQNLIEYIRHWLNVTEQNAKQLPGREGSYEELDMLFKNTLNMNA